MVNKISKRAYERLILKKCEDNRIWLNKMTYISPTDEQKIKLADAILDKLNCKTTQIPSVGITDNDEKIRDLAELTPMLYLRVNWS